MSMKLAFLKSKRYPRIAPESHEEKTINASLEDKLVDQLIDELIEAAQNKDSKAFRGAIEALVLNLFEEETDAQHG